MSKVTSEHHIGIALTRDLEQARCALGAWFAQQMPEVAPVEVISLRPPTANGGSSETYFATLQVPATAGNLPREYVLRIKPDKFRMFFRENFEEQYQLLSYLKAQTDLPVPVIHFYERDPSVLGAPFWIMENVRGQVPSDNPPFNTSGFLFDATVDQRRKLWLSGLSAVAKIAKLEVARLPQIVALRQEETGLDENLRHWTEAMNWASEGNPSELQRQANEWLWAHKPARGDTGLSWGDARIGNMIFRDWECVAILDWDTITLAGPQLDLAHWLFMDEYYTESLGLRPLPGFPTRAETIAQWEELTGLPTDQLAWHEVLAAFRLNVGAERFLRLWASAGRPAFMESVDKSLLGCHLRRVLARMRR